LTGYTGWALININRILDQNGYSELKSILYYPRLTPVTAGASSVFNGFRAISETLKANNILCRSKRLNSAGLPISGRECCNKGLFPEDCPGIFDGYP